MRKLPLSGYEIPFNVQPWKTVGLRSNNCYAYAVNDFDMFRIQKSTPGDRTNKNNKNLPAYYTAAGLRKRMILDNPGKIYNAPATCKCKPNFYKIMMFIAPSKINYHSFGDFHFYKQHAIVHYKVKKGDTYMSIAKFFAIPVARVKAAGVLMIGKTITFKANCFSHKQGYGTGPLLGDSKGNPIRDPRYAAKDYGFLNYTKYGGSMCVKNKGIKVGKTYA